MFMGLHHLVTWDRAEGKAAVTPLLTHWSYDGLEPSLRY